MKRYARGCGGKISYATQALAALAKRAMHAMATEQGKTIIANSVGEDIADLVIALESMARLAKLAATQPADLERAIREELLGEMYFAHWAKWDEELSA